MRHLTIGKAICQSIARCAILSFTSCMSEAITKSPTSGVTHPGTFSGLIEKIPYLKGLGITAVELMPVMDFDDKEVMRVSPVDGKPLRNFWGYSTHSFFAPKCAYCVSYEEGSHLRDFRDMVKAFHRAGIEEIG